MRPRLSSPLRKRVQQCLSIPHSPLCLQTSGDVYAQTGAGSGNFGAYGTGIPSAQSLWNYILTHPNINDAIGLLYHFTADNGPTAYTPAMHENLFNGCAALGFPAIPADVMSPSGVPATAEDLMSITNAVILAQLAGYQIDGMSFVANSPAPSAAMTAPVVASSKTGLEHFLLDGSNSKLILVPKAFGLSNFGSQPGQQLTPGEKAAVAVAVGSLGVAAGAGLVTASGVTYAAVAAGTAAVLPAAILLLGTGLIIGGLLVGAAWGVSALMTSAGHYGGDPGKGDGSCGAWVKNETCYNLKAN